MASSRAGGGAKTYNTMCHLVRPALSNTWRSVGLAGGKLRLRTMREEEDSNQPNEAPKKRVVSAPHSGFRPPLPAPATEVAYHTHIHAHPSIMLSHSPGLLHRRTL